MPSVTSCPLGTEPPRGRGGAGMGQGVQLETGGTSGGMLRGPKGISGRVCTSSPPPSHLRSPWGDRPGPALQGGQGGPARTPNLTPSTRIPGPGPATAGWEGGRGGPAPPGGPRGGIGDIACEGAPDRPGRAAPVTRSHAMGVGGGEMAFKGPGRWPHVQEPGPGSRRRRSSSGSAPPRLAGGGGAPQHRVHRRG